MLIHDRKNSMRLNGYDYSQAGAYFVTIVTQNRACLFGEIGGGEMQLNPNGQIIIDTWLWLAQQYSYVELGDSCLMPNHFHGILWIADGRGVSRNALTLPQNTLVTPQNAPNNLGSAPTESVKSLGQLMGVFKTVSTKQINQLRGSPTNIIWQRNFYDHIIRNKRELIRISQYILDNPFNWVRDEENPGGA